MPQVQKAENLINAIKGMVFLIFLTPLIVVPKSYFPFIFWRTIIFRILVEIIIVIYIALILERREYLPKRSCLIWSVVIFLGVLILTSITSLNFYHSFWSNQERMEGLFTMLHFIALFLVVTGVFQKKEAWYWFFKTSFCVSLIASLYGFLQKIHISWSWVILGGQDRLSSTIGNPAYFAAYLIPHIFLGVILLRRSQARPGRIFYLVGVVFELIMLYWTATRGALLGLLVAVIFLFILSFLRPTRRVYKFIGLSVFLSFLISLTLIYVYRDVPLLKKSLPIARITHISLGAGADNSVQSRFIVWRMALKGWQQRPILGWGPENFHLAFNANLDPEIFNRPGEVWYDRAHNKIFDVAIASGGLGLLSYLAIFLCLTFLLMRHWLKTGRRGWLEPLLLVFFLAYFFQNLFVFDTLATYLMFFLILGFVHVYTLRQPSLSAEPTLDPKPISDFWARKNNPIVAILVVVMIIVVIKANIKPAVANHNLALAFFDTKPQELMKHFETAMFMRTYAQAEARKEFVQKLLQEIQQLKQDKKYASQVIPMLNVALAQTKEAISQDPQNPLGYIYLGRLSSLLVGWGDSSVLTDAEKLLQKAIIICPRRPELYYELANNQASVKNYDAAIETHQSLLALEPTLRDAHWNFGLVLSWASEYTEALTEMKRAETMGYFLGDAHPNDLPSMADVYANLEQFPEAQMIYQNYLKLKPLDAQAWADLAEVNARLGDFASAQEAANQILKIQPQATQEVEKFIQRLKIIAEANKMQN